jgi:hypothetical protein
MMVTLTPCCGSHETSRSVKVVVALLVLHDGIKPILFGVLQVRQSLQVLRGAVRCFPRGRCSHPVITMTFPSMFVLMTFSLLPCEQLANHHRCAGNTRVSTANT